MVFIKKQAVGILLLMAIFSLAQAATALEQDRFFRAIEAGKFPIFANLIKEHPVLIYATNGQGQTGFILAAKLAHEKMALMLAYLGADVNAQDNQGNTGLMLAAEQSHTNTVKGIICYCARLDDALTNNQGKTAAMLIQEQDMADYIGRHRYQNKMKRGIEQQALHYGLAANNLPPQHN